VVKKKKDIQEVAAVAETATVEVKPIGDLRASLEEIQTHQGVIGYILRNSTSAAIDLKDPTKLIDYAILSSSALDAGQELSELFNLGEVKDVIVEGKDVKVISIAIGENKVSVFLDRDADCENILRKLHSLG
jgi:predicted regulator of Ras-like GTPase activity (Roadblock/LC7/MglB family)